MSVCTTMCVFLFKIFKKWNLHFAVIQLNINPANIYLYITFYSINNNKKYIFNLIYYIKVYISYIIYFQI